MGKRRVRVRDAWQLASNRESLELLKHVPRLLQPANMMWVDWLKIPVNPIVKRILGTHIPSRPQSYT